MLRFNHSLITLIIVGLLLVPSTVSAQPVKDVNIANTSANPVPVVVQNGNTEDTVLITLAENQPIQPAGASIDFGNIDLMGFRSVSFLGNASVTVSLAIGFTTDGGTLADSEATARIGSCAIAAPTNNGVRDCRLVALNATAPPNGGFNIAGPFLALRVRNANSTQASAFTLKVFLRR